MSANPPAMAPALEPAFEPPAGAAVPNPTRGLRPPTLLTPAVRKAIERRMLSLRQASLDRIAAIAGVGPEALRRYRQDLIQSELPLQLVQRGAGLPATRELPQAALLYLLVRATRPRRIVETGVRPGYSTSWFLEALAHNGTGELWSIGPGSVRGRAAGVGEGPVGALVPPALRGRWTLILGNSPDRLSEVLASSGPVDLFFSDNGPDRDRSQFELRKAWGAMAPSGIVLAHHVDANPAWAEFCRWQGAAPQLLDSGPPPLGALAVGRPSVGR